LIMVIIMITLFIQYQAIGIVNMSSNHW